MIEILRQDGFKRATWKNGLGFTDEIAIFPPQSSLQKGDFLWRVSSARIERASPFSEFPNHDRTLVVLDGEGIRLFHTFEPGEEPEMVELSTFEPYEFPGDVPSRCELVDGPVKDLSVFFKKAEAEAITQVEVIDPELGFDWVPSGRWNFAFAAHGSFELIGPAGTGRFDLHPGDAARIEIATPLPENDSIRIEGSGVIVLVAIQG